VIYYLTSNQTYETTRREHVRSAENRTASEKAVAAQRRVVVSLLAFVVGWTATCVFGVAWSEVEGATNFVLLVAVCGPPLWAVFLVVRIRQDLHARAVAVAVADILEERGYVVREVAG
jgi:hypothetical protein